MTAARGSVPRGASPRALCPRCLRLLPARTVERDGQIWLQRCCPQHGEVTTRHLWEEPAIYRRLESLLPDQAVPPSGLVINLTNRCNLDCPYCYALANEVVTPECDLAQVRALLDGSLADTVYFSGGEPTLHDELIPAIQLAKARGRRVGLFSNGLRLVERGMAQRLAAAGLDFVILQFDSLDDGALAAIRERRLAAVKRAAVEALRAHRIPVYLYVVVVHGINDGETGELLRFARDNADVVKIINFNPVWDMGRVGQRPQLSASAIGADVARQLGLSLEQLLDCTEFAYRVAQLVARLKRRPLSYHPCCELRVYSAVQGGRLVPISELLDLPAVNGALARLASRGEGWPAWLRTLSCLPGLVLCGVRALFTRRAFRRLLWSALLGRARTASGEGNSLFNTPLVSTIVGTFHTAESLDLAFQRTCNLASHLPQDEPGLPACARQILVDRAARDPAFAGAALGRVARELAWELQPARLPPRGSY